MAVTAGDVVWMIRSDNSGLERGLADAKAKVNSTMENIGQQARRIGAAMTVVGGVITGLGALAVRESANAEGAYAKFNTVFAEQKDNMMDFVERLRGEMPLATHEIVRMAADLQDLLVPLGLTREKATEMSQGFLDLANKIAAFNDVNPAEVIDAFRSGLTGASEPLKRFGINANITALESKAMSMGLLEAGQKFSDLTPEVKSQIVAQALLAQSIDQSSDAINGFAENNDSFIRRSQELKATLKDLGAIIGKPLQDALDKTLKAMLPMLEVIGKWIENNPKLAGSLILIVGGLGALMVALGPLLIALPTIVAILGGVTAAGAAMGAGFVLIAAGIGVGVYTIISYWDELVNEGKYLWNLLWQTIDRYAKNLKDSLVGTWEAFKTFWSNLWDGIVNTAQDAWQKVKDIVSGIISAARDAVNSVLNIVGLGSETNVTATVTNEDGTSTQGSASSAAPGGFFGSSAAGSNTNVTINMPDRITVREDADIDKIADALGRRLNMVLGGVY